MKAFTSIHGNHEKEIINPIPYVPLPGFYKHPEYNIAVSKEGQVFNIRTGNIRNITSSTDNRSTFDFKDIINNRLVTLKVRLHRILARTFLGRPLMHCDKPFYKLQVNHIDGDMSNNSLDNLEWCTHLENIQHAIKNDLMVHYKVIYSKHLETGEILKHRSISEASRVLNIPFGGLYQFINDKRHLKYKHNNYLFSEDKDIFPDINYSSLNPTTGGGECVIIDLKFNTLYIVNSMRQAADFINMDYKTLWKCINDRITYIRNDFLIMKYNYFIINIHDKDSYISKLINKT